MKACKNKNKKYIINGVKLNIIKNYKYGFQIRFLNKDFISHSSVRKISQCFKKETLRAESVSNISRYKSSD